MDKPVITGLSGVLPLAGEINTGNQAADSLLAGVGNIWNTAASAVNSAVRYAGDLAHATDAALTMIDSMVPDELSLTGSGLKEDLYVGSLFIGMNPGIAAEGVQHAKNFTSAIRSSLGGNRKISNTAQSITDWLGPDTQVKTNKSGDKIFISAGGEKRVRFDLNNPSPHSNPHAHLEESVNGRWVKSGPIYPSDLPNN
jgi:hypothetical protein